MADDKGNRGEPDRSRINMSEDYEVEWWTDKFDCTREELQQAVEAAGDSVENVRRYFENKS